MITKSTLSVASILTLALPLVLTVNLNWAWPQAQPVPRQKIDQYSLASDEPNIPNLNNLNPTYSRPGTQAATDLVILNSTAPFTTYLPVVVSYRPPIINGDFEMGRIYSDLIIGPADIGPASANPPLNWTRVSRIGYELFFTQSTQPLKLPIPPQNGIWATWLGGDDYEISYIEQRVTVPFSSPFLIFSYWIQSYDSFCGSQLYPLPALLADFVRPTPLGGLIVDLGGVVVDDNSGFLGVVVADLCTTSQTNGWDTTVINLSQYAGETVTLQIRSKGDSILTSSLFVDNVSLGGVSLTGASSFGELVIVPRPAPLATPGDQTLPLNSDQLVSKSLLLQSTEMEAVTKKGNALAPLTSGR
jgi:hypothetical protein